MRLWTARPCPLGLFVLLLSTLRRGLIVAGSVLMASRLSNEEESQMELSRVEEDAILNTQVVSQQSSIFCNHLYEDKASRVSDDVKKLLYTQNAGGQSNASEAMSFFVFEKTRHVLVATEMEIRYQFQNSPKIDYIMRSPFGDVIGVSVTRAMHHKKVSKTWAVRLLSKKIAGLTRARNHAYDCWDVDVLHVFVMRRDAHKVRLALGHLERRGMIGDVQVIVTILKDRQSWIMTNKKIPDFQ